MSHGPWWEARQGAGKEPQTLEPGSMRQCTLGYEMRGQGTAMHQPMPARHRVKCSSCLSDHSSTWKTHQQVRLQIGDATLPWKEWADLLNRLWLCLGASSSVAVAR